MIVAIDAAYHPNNGIVDTTNAFENTTKASYKRDIIDCLPRYIPWFKLRFLIICIEPSP